MVEILKAETTCENESPALLAEFCPKTSIFARFLAIKNWLTINTKWWLRWLLFWWWWLLFWLWWLLFWLLIIFFDYYAKKKTKFFFRLLINIFSDFCSQMFWTCLLVLIKLNFPVKKKEQQKKKEFLTLTWNGCFDKTEELLLCFHVFFVKTICVSLPVICFLFF